MRTYYLYSLNDPITNEIKYIGITNNCKNRLQSHLLDLNNTKKLDELKS